jgi:adenine phosphoribosyltransferase
MKSIPSHMDRIRNLIRDVPDFPVKGIMFKDITPVLKDPKALGMIIDCFGKMYKGKNIDAIVGIESRGFIIGAPLALKLRLPFVPIRKVGKLPFDKIRVNYQLEYGEATIEIHTDALEKGQRVIIVDDLLATGGTTAASIELVEKLGAEVVKCAFVIELGFLHGRDKLPKGKVDSLITY